MEDISDNQAPVKAPSVPFKRLPLPPGWSNFRARDLFDLRRPLTDQIYDINAIPGWREIAEQAEKHRQSLPEYRFPELLKLDKAAFYSFFWDGVPMPLPPNWERYGRSLEQWKIRGYGTEQPAQEQQQPAAAPQKLDRDQIIAANPLLEYCQARGWKLRRDGNSERWKCLCPFHDEGTPSFTIYPDNHFHCYGCKRTGSVIDVHMHVRGIDVGEAMRELSQESSQGGATIVAEYGYTDEAGTLLFQIVRYSTKKFEAWHKGPGGQWIRNVKGVRIVPYHLDELVKATNEIFITEGEKDADTLRRFKLVATCNPFGAKSWKPEFAGYFKGREIIICPDADAEGQAHCLQVGKNLLPVAKAVSVVTLPPGLKDVTDLYEADREAFFERFRQAVFEAKPFADFQHGYNGEEPKSGASAGSADFHAGAQVPQDNGAAAAPKVAKLTMMTVSQILSYEDNPDDILLSNGYIEKGSPCVLCGPPGIGKSRLALQLAVKSILGQDFLGWQTRAQGLKWAFLQNENGLRRLKADLRAMTKGLATPQMAALEKYLLIHAIVTDTDGHLDLGDPIARHRCAEVVQDWKPDIVVGDPLMAFGTGDLNADQDMLRTAREFGRCVREGDPRRIPFLIHHARTGKEAKAGVAGADRASYARNSKALYGWTRSQFNVAAVNKDDNDKLLFASGKCNNAPEFAKFIIAVDLACMFYAKTDEDPDAAMEEMQGEDGKFKRKFDRKQILIFMSSVVPRAHKDIKMEAIDRAHMSDGTFNTMWKQLKEFEEIEKTGDGKWLKK